MTQIKLLKANYLLYIYLILLALVVLTPRSATSDRGFFWFLSLTGSAERFANFLLLMPLPVLLYLALPKIKFIYMVMAGPVLSFTIESAQLWIPGRYIDWRDYLLNSTGAILTAYIFKSKQNQSLRFL